MKTIITSKVKTFALAGALLSMTAGTLVSCGDFLEIEPRNEITLEKFWNEKADVEAIINGCYSGMQSYGMISRMLIWGEFRSDNVVNRGHIEKDINLEYLLKENITASNPYTAWNEFYNIINRCNTVIEYAPKVSAVDPAYSESELRAHIAEVTAIRSLCYFYLIRTFRDVPYSEKAFLDDNQEMDLPATPFKEVLGKLIASLEAVKNDAVKRYPKTGSYAAYYQTGRVTQLAIQAMLADMYLWMQDYDNCIKYADIVINELKARAKENPNSTFYSNSIDYMSGYPIYMNQSKGMSNFYGLDFDNIFVEGNSNEGIFELSFIKRSGDTQASNGPISNFYGNATVKGWVMPSDYVAQDVKSSNPVVFHNKYDGRAYENIRYAGQDPDGINKYVVTSAGVFTDPAANNFFTTSSWGTQYPVVGQNNDSRNKSNFIFYRLTDVMLMKAEALAMKTSPSNFTSADTTLCQQAFALVNVVNKRALFRPIDKLGDSDTLQMKNYLTKASITDLVYDERNRELMFEGKRYFDLVRRAMREGNTDYLRSKVKQKSADNASVVDSKLIRMDAIFWPYNLNDIKVNKNLHQNPAFGSGENGSFGNTAK